LSGHVEYYATAINDLFFQIISEDKITIYALFLRRTTLCYKYISGYESAKFIKIG